MYCLFLGNPPESIITPSSLELFQDRDLLEELGCSDLHATVLGLDPAKFSIEDRLASTSGDAIDQIDRMGRTALSWVSQKADIKAMKLLLMKGANPNVPDNGGDSPFLHCANNHYRLTTLLEAGAAVNDKCSSGDTKLVKLVPIVDDVRCIHVLWQLGADLDEPTSAGWKNFFVLRAKISYSGQTYSQEQMIQG